MVTKKHTIIVLWDPEAEVFYTRDSTIPGLNAQADTIKEMIEVLDELLPLLIEENRAIMSSSESPSKALNEAHFVYA